MPSFSFSLPLPLFVGILAKQSQKEPGNFPFKIY